jgi:hypothetical protein
MSMLDGATFWVRVWDEDRGEACAVSAASAVDAAMAFAGSWESEAAIGVLTLLVSDGEDGAEQAFLVDLDSGDARAC